MDKIKKILKWLFCKPRKIAFDVHMEDIDKFSILQQEPSETITEILKQH